MNCYKGVADLVGGLVVPPHNMNVCSREVQWLEMTNLYSCDKAQRMSVYIVTVTGALTKVDLQSSRAMPFLTCSWKHTISPPPLTLSHKCGGVIY